MRETDMRSLLLLLGYTVTVTLTVDVCKLEYDSGPCRAFNEVFAYDQQTNSCQQKRYGGCKGNGNKFDTREKCEHTCINQPRTLTDVPDICSLPPFLTKKICMGYFPRFTYRPDIKLCEPVVYGGCGGSDNLFVTLSDCQTACQTVTGGENLLRSGLTVTSDPSLDICALPPIESSPMGCMAFIPKWTFDKNARECVSYIYGGCLGTDNLFETKEECQSKCGGPVNKASEVCSLPISPGPCEKYAIKPSYGFNKETSRCEAFRYGGCQGNSNRFSILENCVNTCGGGEPLLLEDNCQDVVCDQNEAMFQRAKGCVPLTEQGECCPSSWDCSSWERRMVNKSQCFYSSYKDPVGRLYNPGDEILEVTQVNGCHQACRCTLRSDGNGEIICAMVDCHFDLPKGFTRESCRSRYDKLSQCCPSDMTCGKELDSLPTCSIDGETYYDGQKMYPGTDRCVVCHCTKDWDGDISGQFCETVDCGLQLYSDKLLQGCHPIYQDNVCCPVDWICPHTSLTPAKINPTSKSSDKCLLPQDKGPCRKLSPQFYFDTNSRKCLPFTYGGCKGNENRFDSIGDCESSCGVFMLEKLPAGKVDDILVHEEKCLVQVAPGNCRGFKIRFFSNNKTGKCEEFIYTGCQGNKNNYKSVEQCEAVCDVKPTVRVGKDPACNSEVIVGTCRSRLEKFYYDKQSGTCKIFYYSGCQGGENMYDTHQECVASCVKEDHLERSLLPQDLYVESPCEQPQEVGPCRGGMQRWAYNKLWGKCQSFIFSGCKGNDNNFKTIEECNLRCPGRSVGEARILPELIIGVARTLPEPITGHSTSSSFSPEVKKVAGLGAMLFSGVTQISGQECPKVRLLEVLKVTKDGGPKVGYTFTMRLDTRSGPSCSVGVEKICSGLTLEHPVGIPDAELSNKLQLVNLSSISCRSGEEDPCLQDKTIGRCRAAFSRFYFDKDTKSCQPFKYGGCQGNGNNFNSIEECNEVCESHIDSSVLSRTPKMLTSDRNPICLQTKDAGPCFALKPRFYFNSVSNSCEEFIYGGCRGNENNFPSLSECQARCRVVGSSRSVPVSSVPRSVPFPPLLPPLPRCNLGNETFALGDVIRLDGDKGRQLCSPEKGNCKMTNNHQCSSCVCSSPPGLTCKVKVCPALAFLPPPFGVNCRLEKDEYGCCDVGYKCDSWAHPVPPPPIIDPTAPTLGGFGLLGGFRQEGVSGEVKKLAAVATKDLLSNVQHVTGTECSHAQLLEILTVERQIVAGTNFRLKLRMRTKEGSDCKEEVEKLCENILLFRPLPVYCDQSNDCIELVKEEEIACDVI